MNTQAAAAQVGCSPRELRIFLRAHPDTEYASRDERGRYTFDPKDIDQIKRDYVIWADNREAGRQAARVARTKKEATA